VVVLILNNQTTRPKKGKGERFLDCPHYESCLDFAAIQNWKAFNCESCGFYVNSLKKAPASQEEKVIVRICEECGKNPTIQPNSLLCAGCLGKRAWKDKKTKNKGPSKPKRQGIHKAEKVQQCGNMELTIRFGKYASLLTEIEKIAEEEVRPPDLQVIYILKSYLNNAKLVKST